MSLIWSCWFTVYRKNIRVQLKILVSIFWVLFCPVAYCFLRGIPLFLVERLGSPNGHWCLNLTFARGRERDLLTSELHHQAASLSVTCQDKTWDKYRQSLHASLLPAEENYLLCTTYLVDIWNTTQHCTHSSSLSLSLCLCLPSVSLAILVSILI